VLLLARGAVRRRAEPVARLVDAKGLRFTTLTHFGYWTRVPVAER